MSHHNHLIPSPVDYGFHGAKAVHLLGLVGLVLLAIAAYVVWGSSLEGVLLFIFGIITLHLGLGLILGAGGLFWVSRFGRYIVRDKMLAMIPWQGNEQVLDVGCGAGINLIAAARHLTTGMATGIDIWTDDHGQHYTAETVMENARAEGVEEFVQVKTEDGCATSFSDESFDVVLSSFVFHHLNKSQRAAALDEIMRVLKPGGRFILIDVHHSKEISDKLLSIGASEVQIKALVPLLPGLRWVAARKP